MRRGAWYLLLASIPAALPLGCAPSPVVRVMSFNIRYGTAEDGENRWERRRALLFDTIRAADPDILGLQEVLAFQGEELRAALPDLEFVGVGRDDGRAAGEFSPIMYRRARFDLLQAGHVWLSPRPDAPGSKGWDAALPRIATWVVLRTRSAPRLEVHVINTHFDHVGEQARRESARLLCERVAAREPMATILTGDLNCGPGSPPYAAFTGADMRDPWLVLSAAQAEAGTFHGFTGIARGPRIDFVLCNRWCAPLAVEIDRRGAGGLYPSDHFPVLAVLRLDEPGR